VLSLLGPHLNAENAAELFEACRRKSCEQVEELLAARFPKPDVRDSIRRLPARSEGRTPDGGSALPAAPLANTVAPLSFPQTQNDAGSTRDAGPTRDAMSSWSAQATQPAIRAQRKLEPLSADRFGVHFTADAEFRDLLEEVRGLATHREPSGDLLSLMRRGLEAYRRELQKARFGVGRKPRRVRSERAEGEEPSSGTLATVTMQDAEFAKSAESAEPSSPRLATVTMQDAEFAKSADSEEPARRSRHIPAAVARAVYLRDGGGCTFCAADGRRCGARRFLELDHVTPWAMRGESSVENLRLRCRAHNQHSARS
jgi:hypothetical protein